MVIDQKNNLHLFPKNKQVHHYIKLNHKKLLILSKIHDDLTYEVAIEVLKSRKNDVDILWLAKLLQASPFEIKKSLNELSKLSLINADNDSIRLH